MDWINTSRNAVQTVKKYRYVVIVLLVGLLLMVMPTGSEPEVQVLPQQEEEEDLQSQLEALLCHLEGAGKVKVLLTQAAG